MTTTVLSVYVCYVIIFTEDSRYPSNFFFFFIYTNYGFEYDTTNDRESQVIRDVQFVTRFVWFFFSFFGAQRTYHIPKTKIREWCTGARVFMLTRVHNRRVSVKYERHARFCVAGEIVRGSRSYVCVIL